MTKPYFSIRVTGLCFVAVALLFSGRASAQELLPDIRALPASDLSVEVDFFGRTILRLAATTWNAGDGPLELVAGETGVGAGKNKQRVYQRIYYADGSYVDRRAGDFEWHPSHNHFHFGDYATYILQLAGSSGGSARTSNKTTFCVMDTELIDRHWPGASRKAYYTTCGDQIQGMSVGWGDTYGSQIPGQEIDLTDLQDGDYTLQIVADPKNLLDETDETNNSSCMLLHISVTDLTVDVLNQNDCSGAGGGSGGGGDVIVDGVDPNVLIRDSVTPITITGSGFTDQLGVSFENGAGPAPKVSGIDVVSPTEITATVAVNKKAKLTSWDLRVGSAVLAGAITVTE